MIWDCVGKFLKSEDTLRQKSQMSDNLVLLYVNLRATHEFLEATKEKMLLNIHIARGTHALAASVITTVVAGCEVMDAL